MIIGAKLAKFPQSAMLPSFQPGYYCMRLIGSDAVSGDAEEKFFDRIIAG